MLLHELRRLVVFFLVGGFLLVATTQLIPLASAAPDCNMTMMSHGADGGGPVPCTDMTPTCIVDVGCAFVVSLPAPHLGLSAPLSWTRVAYGTSSNASRGLSIKPDLTPPILPA
jgi:hypothetical protein